MFMFAVDKKEFHTTASSLTVYYSLAKLLVRSENPDTPRIITLRAYFLVVEHPCPTTKDFDIFLSLLETNSDPSQIAQLVELFSGSFEIDLHSLPAPPDFIPFELPDSALSSLNS